MNDVLCRLISPSQAAFVPGRSIIDNILLASKVLHCLMRHMRGRIGDVALKLDISKNWILVRHTIGLIEDSFDLCCVRWVF